MAVGKGYSANRTYAALKTFLRWCASRDLIATYPMQGVERPFDGEAPRERSWSDEEIARIWRAADVIGGSAGAALKVLLLTGARRDEVFHLRWSELEPGGRQWRLSISRSKSRRKHVFPLPVRCSVSSPSSLATGTATSYSRPPAASRLSTGRG